MSLKKNTSGYFRVAKQGNLWVYRFYKDGKHHRLANRTIDGLKKEVEKKGYEWIKLE